MLSPRNASRHLAFLLTVAIVLGGTNGLSATQSTFTNPFSAKVIGVSDGDTITVLVSNRQVKIRIEGIDCPEPGQPFSRVAKTFTSQRVYGKTVELQPRETDRYGRLVTKVRSDGADLGPRAPVCRACLALH